MAEEKNEGLVLLDFWVSPFGQRCHIALAEKGIPYEYSEQELLGAKSDLLLRSNPVHKKIPVLLHDGRPVSESLIILNYLDEAFRPDPAVSSSRRRSADAASAGAGESNAVQFALEHDLGAGKGFVPAGTFSARLKTSAHGTQVRQLCFACFADLLGLPTL